MAVNANSYFSANPDVAAAFEQETYGLSPQDFAEAHWLMYGQNEQRAQPETIDPYFGLNPDVAESYGDNRYDMTPDDFSQAHYLLYGSDEQRAQPDALDPYFVQNPDVASAYKQDRNGLSPTDFASTHFDLYGGSEQRQKPTKYVPEEQRLNSGMAAGAPTQIGRSPSILGSSVAPSAAYSKSTFGSSSGERLGAGPADYQSDLIKSLRESGGGPMSQNAGFTSYSYTPPPSAGAGAMSLNSGGAFNPTAFQPDAASADDVQNWNAYNTYKVNSLQAKTPVLSMAEWLAQSKAAPGAGVIEMASGIWSGGQDGGGA